MENSLKPTKFIHPLILLTLLLALVPGVARAAAIERFTFSQSAHFSPGNQFSLFGSADDYFLSDGTNWPSGAGSTHIGMGVLESTSAAGDKIIYRFNPPDDGILLRQTDYNSGDHSSQGELATIESVIVLEAVPGATTATMTGYVEIISNEETDYGQPRFNYFSAEVGALVKFTLTYTLTDAGWSADLFANEFDYQISGYVDFTQTPSGDVNKDGVIDFQDAIVALRILAGIPDMAFPATGDINADGKIGLAEALYDLQVIAGVHNLPSVDNDQDGYSENTGDCDDDSNAIFPGAPEICGDGIDQDCDGADLTCVPESSYLSEQFSSGPGDFVDLWGYQAQGGEFQFRGDGSDYTAVTFWNGGSNPSWSWNIQPEHSNYFTDANISVETTWEGGESGWSYGLALYVDENAQGGANWIGFRITRDGYYIVDKIVNDAYEAVINWTPTFLLDITGPPNRIEAEKRGSNYRFFINGFEVEQATIEGFVGGGVGLETSEKIQASYDNYTVTSPYRGQLAIPSEGYRQNRNQLIYQCMTRTYLWSDQVPSIDYQNYASADDLLEDLKYDALDRWSYIVSKEQHEQLFEEGQYIGVGINIKTEGSSTCRVTFVYPGSPAALAGLQRGDHILTINDQTIESINNLDAWGAVFGADEVGVTVELQVVRGGEPSFNINLEKAMVDIKAALYWDVLSVGDQQVGYLVFNQFLGTAQSDLDTVFNEFKQQGVGELVLDLRYNSGGSLFVAQYLVDRIVRQYLDGQTWLKLSHNDRYSLWDVEYDFQYSSASLSLERLLVITDENTCSASEVLINGLLPFMDVVLIGQTTCGKPVGMLGYDIYDLHISPIEFSIRNATDAGDYFDGLHPTCAAEDDLDHPLGDPAETMLQEALDYVQTGQCSEGAALAGVVRALSIQPRKAVMTGFRREVGAF